MFRMSDEHLYRCYEDDVVPVDKDEIFEEKCKDNNGLLYNDRESLTSCCECLM